LLKPIEDPTLYPTVIHGTYTKFWKLIKEGGLNRMARNHIHFAPGMPKEEGVISGMRGTCDIHIEIDMEGAIKDGVKFYISSNNVILTEGIDGVLSPKYFKKVIRKNGELL
jgi:2'-phosphotransferase